MSKKYPEEIFVTKQDQGIVGNYLTADESIPAAMNRSCVVGDGYEYEIAVYTLKRMIKTRRRIEIVP